MFMKARKHAFSKCLNDITLGFTYLAVKQQLVESTYHKNKGFYLPPAQLYWNFYKHDSFSIKIP